MSPPRARKTLKVLTGTKFQWAAINAETKEFFGTGGGSYTFVNGKYSSDRRLEYYRPRQCHAAVFLLDLSGLLQFVQVTVDGHIGNAKSLRQFLDGGTTLLLQEFQYLLFPING